MFEKNIDIALIGNNYFLYLLGLAKLKDNKKVLLINDQRFHLGEVLTGYLGELEKKFLIKWGNNQKIFALIDIDKYLTQLEICMIVGKRRVRLGNSPWHNLVEIIRKFQPSLIIERKNIFNEELKDLFDPSFRPKFNVLFKEWMEKINDKIFNIKDVHGLDINLFLKDCPEVFRELFFIFKKSIFLDISIDNLDLENLQTFVYSAKGFYQNKLACKGSDLELLHLLISLLSPLFKLDTIKFNNDLKRMYQSSGGQLKNTNINNYCFENNKPWAVELKSFDGIIYPKNIVMMTSLLDESPFSIFPKSNFYLSIQVKMNTSKNFSQGLFLISKVKNIGTNIPIMIFHIEENEIFAKIFILYEKAMKLAFIETKVKELVRFNLSHYFFDVNIDDESIIISKDWDVLVREDEFKTNNEKRRWCKPHKINERIMYADELNKSHNLKNVNYYGPLVKKPFGLLSSLIELNTVGLNG